MVSAYEDFCRVPQGRLYLRCVGKGHPLVALHGGPDFDHSYLLPELDALATAFRLIYYDQRGRGKSSEGVLPEQVSLESELDDLDRLRQSFGLDTMVLLGHSFGALMAMEYTANYPGRVSHLVLMNSAPGSHADYVSYRDLRRQTDADTLAEMQAVATDPAYASGDIEAEARYYRAHFRRALREPTRVSDLVARLRRHFSPSDIIKARAIEQRLYNDTWHQENYDVIARLRGRQPPTLILHGDTDLIPLQCARNIAAGLPGARLEVLADCGHFAHLEKPRELCALVTEFVAAERHRLR